MSEKDKIVILGSLIIGFIFGIAPAAIFLAGFLLGYNAPVKIKEEKKNVHTKSRR